MTHEIRKATLMDADRLVVSLVQAFDDDPIINWFLRQDDKRALGFDCMFRTCLCSLSLPHGEVFTTNECTGGALWFPPYTWKTGVVKELFMLPKLTRMASFRGLKRILNLFDAMEKAHPNNRHYYLQVLGVAPEHQGKGIGNAMIQPILERCDREGCGAYLENSKESNNVFYQKRGFVITGEIHASSKAPPLWQMWREPQ
jgi:ribosomal protein S18 acetylase RimI-like enzyme